MRSMMALRMVLPMALRMTLRRTLPLCLCLLLAPCAQASDKFLRIAVAANFKPALQELASRFERQSGMAVRISAGSTGALYAQIRHGAPFDVFMAADAKRPAKLEEEMRVIPGTRASYAHGRLALWIPGANEVSMAQLQEVDFPLAIANPELAPYGMAAMEVMGARMATTPRLIRGNNAAQATSFIATGNARGGFVPLSHVIAMNVRRTAYWPVPVELHRVIDQQLVALNGASGGYAKWLAFLRTETARRIIVAAGYGYPADA